MSPPDTMPENAPFRSAARQGRFVLPYCPQCRQHHWYPRTSCPFCAAPDIEWADSPGLGRIHAMTIFRAGPQPRVIVYVELDEGPRLLTGIQAEPDTRIGIGQRVQVTFLPAYEPDGAFVPVFCPVPDAGPTGPQAASGS